MLYSASSVITYDFSWKKLLDATLLLLSPHKMSCSWKKSCNPTYKTPSLICVRQSRGIKLVLLWRKENGQHLCPKCVCIQHICSNLSASLFNCHQSAPSLSDCTQCTGIEQSHKLFALDFFLGLPVPPSKIASSMICVRHN